MNRFPTNPSYRQLFREIKQKIQETQIKAMVTVNQQMIFLYWEIGKAILGLQEKEGWGSKIVEQLAKDLKEVFPGMKGFSRRNLLFMRQFAETYPEKIVKQPVSQISWGHNIRLLQKCSNNEERFGTLTKLLKTAGQEICLFFKSKVSFLKDREKQFLIFPLPCLNPIPILRSKH